MDLHKPVHIGNRTLDQLTSEEKLRLEHQRLHEQHKGHEMMHAEMVIILIFTLIVAQIVLIEWKRRHYKSYSLVTLLGMWLVPLALSVRGHWWRFIFIWLVFSCVTGLIAAKALQKPISGSTPRLVYKWFLLLHKLSYVLGIAGYLVMMGVLFGLNLAVGAKAAQWMDAGLLLIFYGLYYGVLGRDISEICADRMASRVGYYSADGMPTRSLDAGVCAVCGNRLLVAAGEEGVLEDTYQLSCGHVFHEFCIRGWCIVGKKQTCPYCKEKVDLRQIFSNPWEKPHMLFGQLLDWLRWLVAWQPLILCLVQALTWALGLE